MESSPAIQPGYMIWTVYLFGFLAGFSELFVPTGEAVEARAPVSAPPAARPAQAPS